MARRFREAKKGVWLRDINEFDSRDNTREITDAERTDLALNGIKGKRITYRRIDFRANV